MEEHIPVVKNKDYEMTVDDLGHEGEGVGKVSGFTVFVPGALPGDAVRVKIVKVKKHFAYGKLLEVLKPSPHRVEARCPAARMCGGCHLQHMDYEAQLDFKTRMVKENLRRIGGIEDVIVHRCMGGESPWNYRNKAQFPVGEGREGPVFGFYAPRSHRIVPVETCHIQHPVNARAVTALREYMVKFDIPAYDETTGDGIVRHLMTRVGFATGEIMVVLVTTSSRLPEAEFVETIKRNIPGVTTVVRNINDSRTNVILGEKIRVLYGPGFIIDRLGGLTFKISPLSFYQVNPEQTEKLYKKAVEYAGLKDDEIVFDVYSGIGTISLFMARHAAKVYGIEVVEPAVKDARENARINDIRNVEFILGPAEEKVKALYRSGIEADVVVLDPPRKGCDRTLLETVINGSPQCIVYVSCNPSTLARDLAVLEAGGYKVTEVQPVDMFPHTAHVETVCLLTSKIKGFE